jgi:hypothetical protein
MDSFFVIVYASFNLPCYEAMALIRIEQMRKNGISFHFLINGPLPPYIPLQKHEYTLVEGEMTPHLFWAPKALQNFLQDFYKDPANEKYKYVLRVNMSTFVNFHKFLWMLTLLPKEKLLGGAFFGRNEKIYLSGTAHLFSKDVAKAYAYETVLDDEQCNTLTEDIVTSYALQDRFPMHDLNFFFKWLEGYNTVEETMKIPSQFHYQNVFFRVRNDTNRNVVDPYIWLLLYQYFA